MGYFIKKSKHGNEGLVLPQGPTSERPISPIEGALRYNTDIESMEYFNGSVFVDVAKSGRILATVDKLDTDGITATYVMSVEESFENHILVFIDGIYQAPGITKNYTISGFNLIFTSIPPAGLEVTVIHGAFSTHVGSGAVFDVPNL